MSRDRGISGSDSMLASSCWGHRSYFHQGWRGWCHPARVQRKHRLILVCTKSPFSVDLKLFFRLDRIGEMKRESKAGVWDKGSFPTCHFQITAVGSGMARGDTGQGLQFGEARTAAEEEVVSSLRHWRRLKSFHP